jgi:hypothetical protein
MVSGSMGNLSQIDVQKILSYVHQLVDFKRNVASGFVLYLAALEEGTQVVLPVAFALELVCVVFRTLVPNQAHQTVGNSRSEVLTAGAQGVQFALVGHWHRLSAGTDQIADCL